jgi:hypothetical protein
MRTGMTGFFVVIARSTSRATKSGLVARARQNENERRRGLDAAYDLIAVGCAGLHVVRRDLAFHAALLEAGGDLLGLLGIGLV